MKNPNSRAKQEPLMPPPKRQNGASLSHCFCFVLQRANLVISRQLDDALRPIGLRSQQLIVLGAIGELGTLRQTALTALLGKDHTTVTANLRLTRRGLVVSAADHDDRRARVITLTRDGKRLLDRARSLLKRFNAELCDRIQSEGSIRDLRAALEALSERQRTSGSLCDPSSRGSSYE